MHNAILNINAQSNQYIKEQTVACVNHKKNILSTNNIIYLKKKNVTEQSPVNLTGSHFLTLVTAVNCLHSQQTM